MAEISGSRLERLLAERGMSQSELGRRVGVKQPSIGRLISGETRSTSVLLEIARELGTTPEFLTCETDDSSGNLTADRRPAFRGFEPERGTDLVELDEIDLRFGLGGTYLDGPAEVSKRQFSRAWLGQFTRAAPDQLVWAMGEGDSMEPTIRTGEVILIDRSQQSPRMADGIWAIAFGEIGMIKRLRPMPDGTLQLHSDNPLIRPETATDGEVHVYGRVVAVIRKL